MNNEDNGVKEIISPATAGVDQSRDKVPKRPIGWPDLAVPVRNQLGPVDRKGIAVITPTVVKKKNAKQR